jgi:hypothetical protein
METRKEIEKIFEARKEKEISDRISQFNAINEMIENLKKKIVELEDLKYKILIKNRG